MALSRRGLRYFVERYDANRRVWETLPLPALLSGEEFPLRDDGQLQPVRFDVFHKSTDGGFYF